MKKAFLRATTRVRKSKKHFYMNKTTPCEKVTQIHFPYKKNPAGNKTGEEIEQVIKISLAGKVSPKNGDGHTKATPHTWPQNKTATTRAHTPDIPTVAPLIGRVTQRRTWVLGGPRDRTK